MVRCGCHRTWNELLTQPKTKGGFRLYVHFYVLLAYFEIFQVRYKAKKATGHVSKPLPRLRRKRLADGTFEHKAEDLAKRLQDPKSEPVRLAMKDDGAWSEVESLERESNIMFLLRRLWNENSSKDTVILTTDRQNPIRYCRFCRWSR